MTPWKWFPFIVLVASFAVMESCSDDQDDGGNEENNLSTSQGQNLPEGAQRLVINQPFMQPPVTSVTPNSLQIASLGLTSEECPPDGPTAQTCRVAAEIKNRFFSGTGPTDISKLLKSADSGVAGALRNVGKAYYPCLDENNTTGGSGADAGGSDTQDYGAFKAVPFVTSWTIGNETFSLNDDFSGHFSCTTYMDADDQDHQRAFGKDDNFFYTAEFTGDRGMGMVARVDLQTDATELWFTVGDENFAGIPAAGEVFGSTDTPGVSYTGSTGITHLFADTLTGLIHMRVVGTGMGDGCGIRFVTNKKALLYHGNRNYNGQCFTGDVDGENYDPTLADVTYCADVSGETIVAKEDTSFCEENGLTSDSFKYPLITREDDFKHYYWVFDTLAHAPDGIPEAKYVWLDVSEPDNAPEGLSVQKLFLNEVNVSNHVTTAACDTIPADKNVNDSFSYSFSSLIQEAIENEKSHAEEDGKQPASDAEVSANVVNFASLSAESGEASSLKFSLNGITNATKWAKYNLTANAKIDGNIVATVSIEDDDSDRTKGNQQISMPIDVSILTAESAISLEITGSTNLECVNDNAGFGAEQKVTFDIVSPRVRYYYKEPTPED